MVLSAFCGLIIQLLIFRGREGESDLCLWFWDCAKNLGIGSVNNSFLLNILFSNNAESPVQKNMCLQILKKVENL